MTEQTQPYHSIAELSRKIQQREITATRLVADCLDRIKALNPTLNAFHLTCAERALEQARLADQALGDGISFGPLHGIPYAAKDLFDVAGLPTAAGCSLLAQNMAERDAAAIAKLSAAGMILVGKTHTVQFAYSGLGINHDHGTPHNPWAEDHLIPGGSSSGSAVAVAAGMVPMALGTDTGGSIRVPSALCGTVGLKTTVGRISRAGVWPLSWSLDSVGPLARTVEDTALIFDCLQGCDPADESTWGRSVLHGQDCLPQGVKDLRLAIPEAPFMQALHPDIEEAIGACQRVFQDLGAQVTRIELPLAEEAMALNSGGLLIAAEAYTLNRKWLDNHFDELDPVVAHRMIKGKAVAAADYLGNNRSWQKLRAKTMQAMARIDALLVPTTPLPALPVARIDTDIETYTRHNLAYLRHTSIGNTLNLCGLSVPCGLTGDGLPMGLMIYGKPFAEDMLLRLGYAFQQATDWHLTQPDLTWI